MTLVVFLASALLCVGDRCYPALVGRDTPVGHFALHRRHVQQKGYGGDVLQFLETKRDIFAIHRVWLGRPSERRAERLARGSAAERRWVTNGCINVAPEIYERLTGADSLEVRP
ncbi:MAG: hypothetical protein ABIT04_00875 [Novosphingobium sp.]